VFDKGDVVVAPGCGVGYIESIEDIAVDAEESVKTYKIVLDGEGGESGESTTDNDKMMVMWVPTHRAVIDGIRRPMEASTVDEVLDTIVKTVAPKKRSNWNRRQRRYRELLMSNDPMQLAELLGELASVRQNKALSFGERRMYERAKSLLGAELKAACNDNVEERFEKALAA
jgi:CarD family transcriptional regulator